MEETRRKGMEETRRKGTGMKGKDADSERNDISLWSVGIAGK